MFPIPSTLFLIPTSIERDLFQEIWTLRFGIPFPTAVHLCGFGPISSGISTCRLLRSNHERVCLLGTAGTYAPAEFAIGTAVCFNQVATSCVGAEVSADGPTSQDILLPSQIGLPQLVSTESADIFETLTLYNPAQPPCDDCELLTVGVAAGTKATVDQRTNRFPSCIAEDMEGFSVALAAHAANVDCSIIRGASNIAGDRNHDNWQIDSAIKSVVDLLKPLICF